MLQINKVYVTDENKNPIAVKVDIRTFEKIGANRLVNQDVDDFSYVGEYR
jgi:hypothetical protein